MTNRKNSLENQKLQCDKTMVKENVSYQNLLCIIQVNIGLNKILKTTRHHILHRVLNKIENVGLINWFRKKKNVNNFKQDLKLIVQKLPKTTINFLIV